MSSDRCEPIEVPLELKQPAAERAELLGDGHPLHEADVVDADGCLRSGKPLAVQVSERARAAWSRTIRPFMSTRATGPPPACGR